MPVIRSIEMMVENEKAVSKEGGEGEGMRSTIGLTNTTTTTATNTTTTAAAATTMGNHKEEEGEGEEERKENKGENEKVENLSSRSHSENSSSSDDGSEEDDDNGGRKRGGDEGGATTAAATTTTTTVEGGSGVKGGKEEEEEEEEEEREENKKKVEGMESTDGKASSSSPKVSKGVGGVEKQKADTPQPPATRRSTPTAHTNTTNNSSSSSPKTCNILPGETNTNLNNNNLNLRSEATDDGYYKHWASLQSLTAGECESSEIATAYGCEAVRHHRGQRGWAGVLGGGTIGMFDTKEEAIKRVVCAAMVMDSFESSPKNTSSTSTSSTTIHAQPLPKLKSSKKSRANSSYSITTTKHRPAPTIVSGHNKLSSSSSKNNNKNKAGDKANPIAISSSSNATNTNLNNAPAAKKTPPVYNTTSILNNNNNTNNTKSPTTTTTTTKRQRATGGGGVILGKRKWKTRDSEGKIRHCEMSDIDTGHILEVFRSCSQAERETKISRTYIGKVCRHGGGILDGRYFRFVYLSPDEVEEHIHKKTKQIDDLIDAATTTTTNVNVNHVVEEEDLMGGDDDEDVSNQHSQPSRQQQQQQQQAGTFSYSLSGVNHTATTDHTPSNNNTTKDNDDVKMGAVRNDKKKTPQSHSSPSSTSPLNNNNNNNNIPNRFDLSTLLPLRKKQKPATRPKKLIELIELATNKVILNFRGNADAGQALNIDRKKIGLACQSYGKKDEIWYGTFKLRYAKTGTKPVAYEYGAHEVDYTTTHKGESHEERKERFQKVFEQDLINGGGVVAGAPTISMVGVCESGIPPGLMDTTGSNHHYEIGASDSAAGGGNNNNTVIRLDSSTISETDDGERGGNKSDDNFTTPQQPNINTGNTETDTTTHTQANGDYRTNASGMIRVSTLLGNNNNSNNNNNDQNTTNTTVIDGRTLVTTRKPSTREVDSTCVVCQEQRANVIFEPCLHCVVCHKCVEKGCCSRFCPSCRSVIEERSRPKMVHLIRPRIYSAYSFM